jgi:hypothetical protein
VPRQQRRVPVTGSVVSVEGDRILLLAVRWRSVGEEGSVVWAWKGVVPGPR